MSFDKRFKEGKLRIKDLPRAMLKMSEPRESPISVWNRYSELIYGELYFWQDWDSDDVNCFLEQQLAEWLRLT